MSPAVHDTITVSGISAVGHHGVFDHERRDGQTFVADVTLHVDSRPAAAADRLDLTVDYGLVSEQVAAVLSGEPADLVETVAERIAAAVLTHPGVLAVDVVVHKPQAPVTVPFTDVTVRIHRDREHVPSVAGPPVVVGAAGPAEQADDAGALAAEHLSEHDASAEPAWGYTAPGFADDVPDAEPWSEALPVGHERAGHEPTDHQQSGQRADAPAVVPTWSPTGVGTGLFGAGAAPGLVGAGMVGAGLAGPPPVGALAGVPGPGAPGSGAVPDATLPDGTLRDATLPGGTLRDGTLPGGTLPGGALPDEPALPDGPALPDTATDAGSAPDTFAAYAPAEPTAVLPVEPDTGRHARVDAEPTVPVGGATLAPPLPPAPAPAPGDRMDIAPAEPVEVVLALGSNLGASHDLLRRAVRELADVPDLEITAIAPLARTGAVGGPPQPDFLNTVVLGMTSLSPRALLHACQRVEDSLGRERAERWGPRTVDIDVIVHGSTVASADDLELPHPRAHERAFVLQPWAQVRPDAVLPGLGGGPVAVLADTAPDRGGIRWMALDWWTAPEGSA